MNGCANNREAGDLRRYRVHYDVTVKITENWLCVDMMVCVGYRD